MHRFNPIHQMSFWKVNLCSKSKSKNLIFNFCWNSFQANHVCVANCGPYLSTECSLRTQRKWKIHRFRRQGGERFEETKKILTVNSFFVHVLIRSRCRRFNFLFLWFLPKGIRYSVFFNFGIIIVHLFVKLNLLSWTQTKSISVLISISI